MIDSRGALRACLAPILGAGLVLAGTAGAGAGAVNTAVELDTPLVLFGETARVHVLVRLHAAEEAPPKQRPPVNLALVLDRSGSMESKGKLAYLKRAAKMVVDRLAPTDRLAVIEYDDRVTVIWPSAPVRAPQMVKRLIDGLTARASTDLAGGMVRGVAEVRRGRREGTLDRVLLLSDGLANVGVTDPCAIRQLARLARQDGVRVTTMGLGLEYDEDMMQGIADASGGNYHYIEHPDQMGRIFSLELNSLFRTTARDVDLTFVPGTAVTGVDVYGVDAEKGEDGTRLGLADFHAGESRTVVLGLDVEPAGVGSMRLGTLRLAYHDVDAEAPRRDDTEVVVDVTRDQGAVDAARNGAVVVETALVESERAHAAAVAAFQKGDHAVTRRRMERLAASLEAQNAGLGDLRIAKKIEALRVETGRMEAITAMPDPAGVAAFAKASKLRLHRARTGARSLYMLRPGDAGVEVERLQKALAGAGYYAGPADGRFGADVGKALRTFQGDHQLDADGIAGAATLERLGLY